MLYICFIMSEGLSVRLIKNNQDDHISIYLFIVSGCWTWHIVFLSSIFIMYVINFAYVSHSSSEKHLLRNYVLGTIFSLSDTSYVPYVKLFDFCRDILPCMIWTGFIP